VCTKFKCGRNWRFGLRMGNCYIFGASNQIYSGHLHSFARLVFTIMLCLMMLFNPHLFKKRNEGMKSFEKKELPYPIALIYVYSFKATKIVYITNLVYLYYACKNMLDECPTYHYLSL